MPDVNMVGVDDAPAQRLYFTPAIAREILRGARAKAKDRRITVSLDLNRSRAVVRVKAQKAILPNGIELSLNSLRAISRRGSKVFVLQDGELVSVERRGNYYYKLMATDAAPTLEISGVKMHRTEGCCPYVQAEAIVRTVVRPGDRVLDTCGGLGYTAIWAARLGADRVVSVEYDMDVLEVARLNPWSEEYFFDSRIDVLADDVTSFLSREPAGSFDAAVHDPPHISRAGELYGRQFYFEISRVLRSTGRLYHYVGEPYTRRGHKDIHRGVADRLSSAGLEPTYVEELAGFVCTKRR
ncbi:MAG: methyltransferase [Candidatus Brocadiae bacterium]|nr:methyltransferase [Candidatus Brocadiia bacterium]